MATTTVYTIAGTPIFDYLVVFFITAILVLAFQRLILSPFKRAIGK